MRLRRCPAGILSLRQYLRQSERCRPIHTTDTDRIGFYYGGLALRGGREVVQAHLGNIEYDAFALSVRQYIARRDDYLGVRPRQPTIDVGIREDDFILADAKATGHVEQSVVVLHPGCINAADQVNIGRRQNECLCVHLIGALKGRDHQRKAGQDLVNACFHQHKRYYPTQEFSAIVSRCYQNFG